MQLSPTEIRELRERTGLSQSKFGQLLGVSGATVGHWEVGIRTPPPLYHANMMKLRSRIQPTDKTADVERILMGFLLAGGILAFLGWLFQDERGRA